MNQLHYKKTALWIILIALIACVVVSGCSQTYQTKGEPTDLPEQTATATPVTTETPETTETPTVAYQSASIVPEELVGKWVIDPVYTKRLTGMDMQVLYGTAFGTYGCGMEFDKEGNFNYYIAIRIGGQGSYAVANQYQDIHVEITEYVGEQQVEFVIQVVSIEGNVRLLMYEGSDLLVWEKV